MTLQKQLILATIVTFSCAGHAQVYKWVDENGVTHFGTSRPAHTDSQKMNLKNPHLSKQQQYANLPTNSTKPIKTPIRHRHNYARSQTTKKNELNCAQAITAAQHHIVVKSSVNEKNYVSGYISRTNFVNSVNTLKRIKNKLSVPKCNSATGPAEQFYKCVNNNVNKLTECSRKYRFE